MPFVSECIWDSFISLAYHNGHCCLHANTAGRWCRWVLAHNAKASSQYDACPSLCCVVSHCERATSTWCLDRLQFYSRFQLTAHICISNSLQSQLPITAHTQIGAKFSLWLNLFLMMMVYWGTCHGLLTSYAYTHTWECKTWWVTASYFQCMCWPHNSTTCTHIRPIRDSESGHKSIASSLSI